jgi:outer membrane protein TolC
MKNKLLIISLILVLGSSLFAQDIPEQYLITAADSNPDLKAKFNEYMAALEVVPQVSTLPDPRVAFGYFITPVETRVGPQRAKISVDQLFPWFGQYKANEDVATEQAKAKYEVFNEARAKLFFDVKSTYYDLYFIRKAVDITLENIDILHTFRQLSLIRIEAGMSSTVDQLRIDMELADLENQLALLRDQLLFRRVSFNKLLNVDRNNPVIFPDSLHSADLQLSQNEILDSIFRNNHQLAKLDFEFAAFENREIAARKTGSPKINIGFDYIFVGKSDNPNLDPGMSGKDAIVFPRIGLTVPLFRKKYKAMVQEAVYMQQSVTEKKVAKSNALETLLENAFKEYRDANRRIVLYNRQKSLAFEAMQILQTSYSTGHMDFEEVLRMENRWLKYTLELKKAITDKQASKAFIGYLMGN